MQFAFFSRKNGFEVGFPVRVYASHLVNDPSGTTIPFIGMSGKQILSFNNNILHQNANANLNWYYYPVDTVFTDIRTLG